MKFHFKMDSSFLLCMFTVLERLQILFLASPGSLKVHRTIMDLVSNQSQEMGYSHGLSFKLQGKV